MFWYCFLPPVFVYIFFFTFAVEWVTVCLCEIVSFTCEQFYSFAQLKLFFFTFILLFSTFFSYSSYPVFFSFLILISFVYCLLFLPFPLISYTFSFLHLRLILFFYFSSSPSSFSSSPFLLFLRYLPPINVSYFPIIKKKKKMRMKGKGEHDLQSNLLSYSRLYTSARLLFFLSFTVCQID